MTITVQYKNLYTTVQRLHLNDDKNEDGQEWSEKRGKNNSKWTIVWPDNNVLILYQHHWWQGHLFGIFFSHFSLLLRGRPVIVSNFSTSLRLQLQCSECLMRKCKTTNRNKLAKIWCGQHTFNWPVLQSKKKTVKPPQSQNITHPHLINLII